MIRLEMKNYNTILTAKQLNYDDYSLMVSEAKNKATKGTGLKILTPK